MAASYPAAVKTFREKENLAGLNYDSDNKRTLFVEDLTQIEDEVIAIEEELGAEVSGDAETLADRLDEMEAATAAILSAVYPVGSIYINASNSSNPARVLGFGTWVEFGEGRVLVGFDSNDTDFDTLEEAGGSKTNTHNHWTGTANDGNSQFQTNTTAVVSEGGRSRVVTKSRSSISASSSSGRAREDSTYNETISVMQPYVTVNMWKRTA